MSEKIIDKGFSCPTETKVNQEYGISGQTSTAREYRGSQQVTQEQDCHQRGNNTTEVNIPSRYWYSKERKKKSNLRLTP